jgi:hypothetical protein
MRLRMTMVTLALVFVLAGCDASPVEEPVTPPTASTPASEPTTDDPADTSAALDAYIAAAQPSIEALLASTPGFSDFQIRGVHPDTMEYLYVYAQAVDPTAGGAVFDAAVATFQGTVDSVVFPEMVRAGITSPRVTYTYQNPDGTTVWSRTFDPS